MRSGIYGSREKPTYGLVYLPYVVPLFGVLIAWASGGGERGANAPLEFGRTKTPVSVDAHCC